MALLQDFLRPVGLTLGLEGLSIVSICLSCLTVSECPSSASSVCVEGGVEGDGKSVRGDLCGGAVMGLVEEHLFDVCFIEFTLD